MFHGDVPHTCMFGSDSHRRVSGSITDQMKSVFCDIVIKILLFRKRFLKTGSLGWFLVPFGTVLTLKEPHKTFYTTDL